MIKAIIFDLDGLLIDTEIVSYKIYRDILAKYNYTYSIEEYAENYSGKPEEVNVQRLIDTYFLPFTLEECIHTVFAMEKEYIKQGIDLKAGAKDLIDYLKKHNYKIAVASSSVEKRALDILECHKLKDDFDAFVFSHEVQNGKPHPEIFLKACDKLNVKLENCLVLEDSEAGIMAACAAQIPVLCVPDLKMPSSIFLQKTTKVLPSLQDVISYLQENK